MKILEKRPLALILCIMLGGFSFFIDFTWKVKLIFAVVSLLIIGSIYLFDNLKVGRKPIVIISLIAFCISMLLSILWSCTFFPTEYYGSNVTVEARVYDIDNSESTTSVIVCKTEKINGVKDNHKFVAYVDKETSVYIRKYDVIKFTADVKELTSSDDGFDGKSYYVAKGFSAMLSNFDNLEVIDNKTDKVDLFFDELRLKVSNTFKLRSDFETGAFLTALIIGDRSDLSGNAKLNFSRLGITHILALSGMHLAMLCVAAEFILIKLNVKKKSRLIVMIFLVIGYIALTGFIASILRSAVMLIFSYVLFLISNKSDSITALVISVFIIILFNPTSVYDLSLWLSVFATLGVIVVSESAEKPDKSLSLIRRIWISFKNYCLVSVFAFCATFMLCALQFDYFSVASIFATLLFSFIIQVFVYGGVLLLIFGGIINFGPIIIALSDFILWSVEKVSSIKYVYVSMNSIFTKILILVLTVYFFAFLILEMKNRKRGVIILVALMLSVFLAAEIHTVSNAYKDDLTYAPSTSGDSFILKTDGEISVIYSGKSFMDDAWVILDLFADENLVYVDNLVLANYSYSTVDFLSTMMSGIKIDKIMLPRPQTSDEINQVEGILYLIEDYETGIKFYDLIEYVPLGEYEYRLFDKADYTYGKYPSNTFEIRKNDKSITYVSVCEYTELSASAKALLYNSENLVIGSIGNSNYYIFDMRLPDIENLYYYDEGRLTDEALDYYKTNGASVKLTETPLDIFD